MYTPLQLGFVIITGDASKIVCSLHVVTNTKELCYSNRSHLNNWHFLDLVCSVHVVTITTMPSFIVKGVASKSGNILT